MRAAFCVFAALIAGVGLALVLALGTASFTAASYKSREGVSEPVFMQVQATSPAILTAAIIGFVIGAGVIVWMFSSSKAPSKGPAEDGPDDRSEV